MTEEGYPLEIPVYYLLPCGLLILLISVLAVLILDHLIYPLFDFIRRERKQKKPANKELDPDEILKLVYALREDIAVGADDDDIKHWVKACNKLVGRNKERNLYKGVMPEVIVRVPADADICKLQRLTSMYSIPSLTLSNSFMSKDDIEYVGLFLGPIRRSDLDHILSYVK